MDANAQKVAVVTGANKGIGLAIVKKLCVQFKGIVYLTARDSDRGTKAVEALNKQGLFPSFHELDVESRDSIVSFAVYIKSRHGRIDVLVNNAAVCYTNKEDPSDFAEQSEHTIKVNYTSLKDVCLILFPLLRPHSRVVNVSSSSGHLLRIPGASLRRKFADPDLKDDTIDKLMKEFVKAAKKGSHEEDGWPNSAYVVSKVGVSALTRVQQKAFLKDHNRLGVIVNSVHPGYCDTDMTGHKGTMTPEQGAEAPVYLALLPEETTTPRGEYVWFNLEIVDWIHGPVPQNKEDMFPEFHQLDIDDPKSINEFKEFLKKKHGNIDALINNAAIAYKNSAKESFGEQAENTIKTNYFSLKNVCNALFEILRPHARVVNLSSSCGHLLRIPSPSLREKFADPQLTESSLDGLMNDFVRAAKNGTHNDEGWPNNCYVVSKVGVSALSRIQQRELLKDPRPDIVVNHVHPGYVDTDMTSHLGVLKPEQGADAPTYLALLPENIISPKGDYVWYTREIYDWTGECKPKK